MCVPVDAFEVVDTGESDCSPALLIRITIKDYDPSNSSNYEVSSTIAKLNPDGTIIENPSEIIKYSDCRRTIKY
jgi:hypothetical protein